MKIQGKHFVITGGGSGLGAATAEYLVEKGAKAELLSAKGYGPSTPLADNATPDGKAQNRRVELKILP